MSAATLPARSSDPLAEDPAPGGKIASGWILRPGRRRRRASNLSVMAASIWLGLIAFAAIFADLLPLVDPTKPEFAPRLGPSLSASFNELLGTDAIGRSELSQVIYGARASLLVGFSATLFGMSVGVMLGLVAGFLRGRTEQLINILLDTLLAFPPLILLLALTSVLTPSTRNLIVALALISVPGFGRVARANTLLLAKREFVDAAKVLGASRRRILTRELAPNVIVPVLSITFIAIASLIVAEGSLSFLGLGIPAPTPSWGRMMAAGRSDLEASPHLVFVPAIVLFLTVLALNTIGDRLRSRLDVRQAAI